MMEYQLCWVVRKTCLQVGGIVACFDIAEIFQQIRAALAQELDEVQLGIPYWALGKGFFHRNPLEHHDSHI